MDQCIIKEDLEDIYRRNIPWECLNNKTVMITGAYGMLASYLMFMLIYLNECKGMKIDVIAAVRSKEKFEKRFGNIERYNYIRLYTQDINKEIMIEEKIDYIIHAASLASPQYYSVCPIEVLTPNVIANYYLLQLAEKKKVEGYLLFSTGDIYGVVDKASKIKESDMGTMDTLDIHNCYSESKRMAETMCKAWYWQKKVPTRIVRIWHTYAPTMDTEGDPRVFASFVNDIVSNRDIVMKSDGSAKRSFCYIADAVAGYFLVLLCGADGEAYNVCNTQEFYSISQLAEILTSIYPEKNLKVIRKEREITEAYTENSVANYVPPDNEKLKLLGWEARYSVKEGFKRVLDSISKDY